MRAELPTNQPFSDFLPPLAVEAARARCVEFVRKLRRLPSGEEERRILRSPSELEAPVGLLTALELHMEPEVQLVLEHDRLFWLMKSLMSGIDDAHCPIATVEYKWLRAVPTGKFTGIHVGS